MPEVPDQESVVSEEVNAPAEQTPAAPDNYDQIGYEFNKEIADLLHKYEPMLPVFFMIKIMQNIVTDLLFKQVGYQIHYTLKANQEETPKGKIIV